MSINDTPLDKIATAVKNEIKHRSLTAERLGDMIDVDPRLIRKITDGKRVYSDYLAQVLSEMDLVLVPRRLVDSYCDIAGNPNRVLLNLILSGDPIAFDRKDLIYAQKIIEKLLLNKNNF